MAEIALSGSFDDFRASHVRVLHEASKLGPLHVFLWSDRVVAEHGGSAPRFPVEERLYLLDAMRWVSRVTVVDDLASTEILPDSGLGFPGFWVVTEAEASPEKAQFCRTRGIELRILKPADVAGFPEVPVPEQAVAAERPKVVVTGCYDWFHSGHVRFFEECGGYGDLYVVVGNDANVRLLKGEDHPMFPEDERRYVVASVRYVTQALVSSGSGWLDAAPEIARIGADIYAVNEDGDKPEKRRFCEENGLRYLILKRTPKEGLPRRESTHLRGY